MKGRSHRETRVQRGLCSPVQCIHLSICKVDIVFLLMLQLVDGDAGKGRKLLPKHHLEPKTRGIVNRTGMGPPPGMQQSLRGKGALTAPLSRSEA